MVSWQKINTKLVTIGGGGTVAITLILIYIFQLAGMSYYYQGNEMCNELECKAYLFVDSTYWEIYVEYLEPGQTIYVPGNTKLDKIIITENRDTSLDPVLYKKSTYGRRLWLNLDKFNYIYHTSPNIPINIYITTTKSKATYIDESKDAPWKYWRELKDGDALIKRRGTSKILLLGNPSESQIIKWTFELPSDDLNVSIAPYWVSWNYEYGEKRKEVPIMGMVTEKSCKHDSVTNATYDCKNIEVEKIVDFKTTIIPDKNKKDGIIVGGQTYKSANIKDNYLYVWNIPIGDRNMGEFGECRDFELNRGICEKISVGKIIKNVKKTTTNINNIN